MEIDAFYLIYILLCVVAWSLYMAIEICGIIETSKNKLVKALCLFLILSTAFTTFNCCKALFNLF